MITDGYWSSRQTLYNLKRGLFAEHIRFYIGRHRRRGQSRAHGNRYLRLARVFGFWLATSSELADVQDELVTQCLAERSRHRPPNRREALAPARLLSVLRDTDVIVP